MATRWYVVRGGNPTGPFTAAQMRRQVATGDLRPDDLVQLDGRERRVRAGAVRGLFPPPILPPAVAPGGRPGRAPLLAVVAAGSLCAAGILLVLWQDAKQAARAAEADRRQAERTRPATGEAVPAEKIQVANYLPTPTLSKDREQLLAERADLEKGRVDLERQRRELAEERLNHLQMAAKAQEFSALEFGMVKEFVAGSADLIGRRLLGGTHPTGTYVGTDPPVVTLSGDRRHVGVSVTVRWKGGLSETPYETAFATTLNRKDGMGTLVVLRDTAIIKIDPEFLRRTESGLRDHLRDALNLAR